MSILFATDFSAAARLAGDVATRIARSLGDRLAVLHVVDRTDGVEEGERELARLGLAAEGQRVVRSGPVAPTIARYAEETHARCVVIGAEGTSARGAILGTVATALAARAPTALWVVRNGERLAPFFDKRQPLRVALPHGRDDSFAAARDALLELNRIGPLDALIVYAPDLIDKLAPAARAAIERELSESVLPRAGLAVRVEVREAKIGKVDVATRLVDAIKEHSADLVLCGTHQRRGVERAVWGSIAAELVRRAPCTVMVAPPSSA